MDIVVMAQKDADFSLRPQAVDQSGFFTDTVDEYEKVIDRVCEEAALVYGLGPKAEISILLCHNDYIHTLNKQYRNIDRPTDVLSFALNEGEEDGYDGPDTALLGDIIISL